MDARKIDHEKVKKAIKNLTIKIGKCFEGEDINIVIESLRIINKYSKNAGWLKYAERIYYINESLC